MRRSYTIQFTMIHRVKTASQCDAMKLTSVRSPADGEEEFPPEVHEEKYKKRDFCNMPRTEVGQFSDNNKYCNESPAVSEQGTPPYFRWAQNLHNLLKDSEGTELFQEYLNQESHSSSSLNFWFACEGLKRPENQNALLDMIKVINRTYVCGMRDISLETKQEIAKKIASNVGLDKTIFDKAQKEVETVIEKTTYPNFIRSDLYMQHIQHMQNGTLCRTPENEVTETSSSLVPLKNGDSASAKEEPSKTSVASANVKNSHGSLDMLQTVYEDSELQLTTCNRVSMTRKSLFHWRKFSDSVERLKPESQAGHYLSSNTPGYNYYAKYAAYLPPSAQDSELQSLSSDAQTDDTMSMVSSSTTDCDTDYIKKNSHKKSQKQHKLMKQAVPYNNDTLVQQCNFIPRTERLPEQTKLSPQEFASILRQKLTKVLEERELNEKLKGRLLDEKELQEEKMKENVDEKKAQAILDDHVSRVFSAHQTPSPSLGCLTPDSQLPQELPTKHRDAYSGSSSQTHASSSSHHYQYNACFSSGRHRRELDGFSSDSGTDQVTDYSRSASYQHHHHGYQSVEPPYDHSLDRCSRDSRSSSGKKLSSADCGSMFFDSGVSGIDVASCASSREKVTTWLEMKKYTDVDRNMLVHQKKSSPSISPLLGQSRDLYDNQSTQLIAQNPNMPPLSYPDTSAQLYETSRRLDMIVKQKKRSARKSYPVSAPVNALPPSSSDKTPVAYCYGRGTVPYLSKLPGKTIILKQFKSLLSKKGNFRYYFKKANEDFGVVFEEITDDSEVLPLWEGKIFCLIEQMD